MHLEPVVGKIIAEPLVIDDLKTDSGIYIAKESVEVMRFVQGKVIECAKDKYLGEKMVPMTVKKDDIIYFDQMTTREFQFEGKKYFSLEEDKIYGIVRE